jgi:hypothetical protein
LFVFFFFLGYYFLEWQPRSWLMEWMLWACDTMKGTKVFISLSPWLARTWQKLVIQISYNGFVQTFSVDYYILGFRVLFTPMWWWSWWSKWVVIASSLCGWVICDDEPFSAQGSHTLWAMSLRRLMPIC